MSFINGWTFGRGQEDGPPETFNNIPKVFEMGGLGKSNPLINVTSFDSLGEEYIAGLADGSEISMGCVLVLSDPEQQAMIAKVDAGENGNLQFVLTDGATTVTLTFNVVYTNWEYGPSYNDKNTVSFTLKISGAITKVYS